MIIADVVLSNLQAALLYFYAFVGLWHVLGIPPIVRWFKR